MSNIARLVLACIVLAGIAVAGLVGVVVLYRRRQPIVATLALLLLSLAAAFAGGRWPPGFGLWAGVALGGAVAIPALVEGRAQRRRPRALLETKCATLQSLSVGMTALTVGLMWLLVTWNHETVLAQAVVTCFGTMACAWILDGSLRQVAFFRARRSAGAAGTGAAGTAPPGAG